MQIRKRAGNQENELRRKNSENAKNPEMTEEQRCDWGTQVHNNGQNLGIKNNNNKQDQTDNENNE